MRMLYLTVLSVCLRIVFRVEKAAKEKGEKVIVTTVVTTMEKAEKVKVVKGMATMVTTTMAKVVKVA
jgi:hypothetical protein